MKQDLIIPLIDSYVWPWSNMSLGYRFACSWHDGDVAGHT